MSLRRGQDLKDRLPGNRNIGINTLRTIIAVWTNYETMVRLDETCFIYGSARLRLERIDLLDDDLIRFHTREFSDNEGRNCNGHILVEQ
jgi:hypothetical protein